MFSRLTILPVLNYKLLILHLLGLTVIEVAHDFVPKIKNWLATQNIQNSFDTWHGKESPK